MLVSNVKSSPEKGGVGRNPTKSSNAARATTLSMKPATSQDRSALPYTCNDLDSAGQEVINDRVIAAFHSPRLTRKLSLFTQDVWSSLSGQVIGHVTTHGTSPLQDDFDWLGRLTQQARFLFPFQKRLDYWRVSTLSLSRSVEIVH